MTKSRRPVEFSALTLAGISGYVWCGITHICRDGHLYHDDMPKWWLYADFLWAAAFIAAAVAALRSDISGRFVISLFLVLLVCSRLLLASGGGGFEIVELPILIYLIIRSLISLRRILVATWKRVVYPGNN